VHKLDLATIKDDCYFATDEMDKMTNPHKRNMIYWWYATNIYSICSSKKGESSLNVLFTVFVDAILLISTLVMKRVVV